jgi:hypothetical protein
MCLNDTADQKIGQRNARAHGSVWLEDNGPRYSMSFMEQKVDPAWAAAPYIEEPTEEEYYLNRCQSPVAAAVQL